MATEQTEGFLLINKPTGYTSFYCIKRIRSLFSKKIKVGHAGTLDSFATGLLIIAINRTATKHINSLINLDKWYTATGKLGQLTDTLDFTGQLLKDEQLKDITEKKIKEVLTEFTNGYVQIPPAFSALKHEGRRLSYLVRAGKLSENEIQKIRKEKAREITIYSLELISFDDPFFTIKAHVSHGTYIRTLMNDIAKKLGTHATTHELERTKIGPFSLSDATPLNEFESEQDIAKHIISIESMEEIIAKYSVK